MRILKVEFENLNSLVGKFEIDFTRKEFVDSGIFAIIGETGAGKSTILDAISLALFCKTPRLDITNDKNDIMSRLAKHCYSEVTFSINNKIYKTKFTQKRSSEKAQRDYGVYKFSIINVTDDKVVSSGKRKDDLAKLIDIIGMDSDQFQKSVMLSQGAFTAFLKANDGDKAQLLKKITNTAIYDDISIAIFETKKKEENNLNDYKEMLQRCNLLTKNEIKEIHANLKTYREKQITSNKNSKHLQNVKKWFDDLAMFEKKINDLQIELKNFQQQKKEYKIEVDKLYNAQKADLVNPTYKEFLNEEKSIESYNFKLKKLNDDLKTYNENLQTENMKRDQQKKKLSQLRHHNEKLSIIIKQVRELDTKLIAAEDSLINPQKELADKKIKLKNLINSLKKLENDKNQKQTEIIKSKEYLYKYQNDDQLHDINIRINTELENVAEDDQFNVAGKLKEIKEKIKKEKDIIQNNNILLAQNKNIISSNKLLISQYQKNIEELVKNSSLEKLNELLNSKQVKLIKIQTSIDLAEQRANLVDSEPCPLCGATNHPFASKNDFNTNDLEKEIKEIKDIITNISDIENKINHLKEQSVDCGHNINKLNLNKEKKQFEIDKLTNQKKEYEEKIDNINNILNNINQRLNPFQIKIETLNNLKPLYARIENYKTNSQSLEKYQQLLKILENNIEHLQNLISSSKKELIDKQNEVNNIQNNIKTLKNKRTNLFENKNCDIEEEKSTNNIIKQEDIAEKMKIERETIQQNIFNLNKDISKVDGSLEKLQELNKNTKNKLDKLLKENDFSSILQMTNAILTLEEQHSITKKNDEINSKINTTKTLIDNNKIEYDKLKELNLTTKSKTEINKEIEDEYKLYEEILNSIHDSTGKLQTNNEKKKTFKKIQSKIDQQTIVYNKWKGLSDLIGSKDGKALSRLVQGITFDVVIKYANQQLKLFTDRYILKREDAKSLDLSVVDNYNAGQIRTIKNLSGGETFMVSLALALGLSHISSKNIRVESLFLDEGFATLDENTLEHVLEELAKLREQNKLIGIISHVELLKEKIPTHINVTKIGNGKSKLSIECN